MLPFGVDSVLLPYCAHTPITDRKTGLIAIPMIDCGQLNINRNTY